MPQHHDIGRRKRAYTEHAQRTETLNPTTDTYARSLVRRGLASPAILDHHRGPKTQPSSPPITEPPYVVGNPPHGRPEA